VFRNQCGWRQRSALVGVLTILLFCSQSAEADASALPSLRGFLSSAGSAPSSGSIASPTSDPQLVPDSLFAIDLDEELAPLTTLRYESNCSISGFVFVDADNNGLKGPYDVVFQNAKIIAFNEADPNTLYSAETDGNGMYYIGGLPVGTYTLWQETQPEDFIDGKDIVGSIMNQIGQIINDDTCGKIDTSHDSRIHEIQLLDDYHGFNYNFAERGLAAHAVSKRLLLSPEPSSLLLLICGGLCLLSKARGRRSRR
jgi:hypothetical protein